jgi:hypothetical protein
MYKVGDFVMLGSDKYEGKVYGIIVEINEDMEYVEVFWLDGYGMSQEDIESTAIFNLSKVDNDI